MKSRHLRCTNGLCTYSDTTKAVETIIILFQFHMVVHKSRTEYVEVEEISEVDARVEAKRIAKLVGVEVAEGAALHQAVHRAVEHILPQIATQRVPHHPSLVIGR